MACNALFNGYFVLMGNSGAKRLFWAHRVKLNVVVIAAKFGQNLSKLKATLNFLHNSFFIPFCNYCFIN